MGGIYWLASYPKSGNTWFRAVLANYLSKSNVPVDINSLGTGTIASSREWVDDIIGVGTSDMTQNEVEAIRPEVYRWMLDEAPTQIGYHKIHDAYRLTDEGRPMVDDIATLGAVYILRNPLDVAASLANHDGIDVDTAISRMADPDRALARSEDGLSAQLLQRLGTWSHHVKSWVDASNLNVFVLRYEDMQFDPVGSFGNALEFMNIELVPQKLEQAIHFSRFDVLSAQESERGFRERPAKAKTFFRKGHVGDWRTSLTEPQIKKVVSEHREVMQRFGYLDPAGQLN